MYYLKRFEQFRHWIISAKYIHTAGSEVVYAHETSCTVTYSHDHIGVLFLDTISLSEAHTKNSGRVNCFYYCVSYDVLTDAICK